MEFNVGGWFGGIKVGAGTSFVTWCNELGWSFSQDEPSSGDDFSVGLGSHPCSPLFYVSQFFTFCDTFLEHVAADDMLATRVTQIWFWRHVLIQGVGLPNSIWLFSSRCHTSLTSNTNEILRLLALHTYRICFPCFGMDTAGGRNAATHSCPGNRTLL